MQASTRVLNDSRSDARSGIVQPSVLVVDDNVDVRMILTLRLRGAGFDVVTAADGVEGLAALRRRRPCCVLLDLMMPRMDGFEFLAVLRRSHSDPPPVLVVTDCNDRSTYELVHQLGADRVLSKGQALHPEFGEALRLEFDRALNQRRLPAPTLVDDAGADPQGARMTA